MIQHTLQILCLTYSLPISANYFDEFLLSTASGSSRIGERCYSHTDCVQGGYCEAALCRCMATHVPLERYCWKKMGPEESGCTYDEQCEAAWPGSRCQYSICRCPPNMRAAFTREGTVCHIPGQCPTNGMFSMLFDRNTDSPAQCFFFDGEVRAGRFIGCDDFPEVHDCIDGLCCPTKAMTCIQPLDTGYSGNGSQDLSRWYFNPDSMTCQEFRYTGQGGNANNFLTKDHCSSYCVMRCPRGQPQLDSGDSATSQTVACGVARDVCDEKFECTQVNGASICCPSTEFLCSEWGGVSSETVSLSAPTSTTPFSAGSNREGQVATSRWYWDSSSKSCRTFKYHGQGGNYNNFVTEDSCMAFCGKAMCPIGTPLRDSSSSTLSCSTQSHCPRSHQCNQGICCPTAVTVCNQPLSVGTRCATSPSLRYWFNAALGSCQEFDFEGCHGNSNSFASMTECQKICSSIEMEPKCERGTALQMDGGRFWRCGMTSLEGSCPAHYECRFDGKHYGCCPTKAHICSSASEQGTICSPGMSLRWYFDSSSNGCRSFSFGGCDGNGNNFASQRECVDYCQAAECPEGGSVLVDSRGSIATCTIEDGGCPDTHQCTRAKSSFLSSERRLVCCPTRKFICSLPSDEGDHCSQSSRRYFFDASTLTCRSFTFQGCSGNANNFPSKMACFNYCHSAACAPSEVVYQTSTEVFDCTRSSCPREYSCVADIWQKQTRVCCGAPNFGVCPAEQRAFVDYRSQQPVSCTAGGRESCPQGFHCLFNQLRNNFYCCGDANKIASCPPGSRLARLASSGDVIGCSADSPCSEGGCHQPDPLRSGVCCHNLDSVCPPTFTYDQELSEQGECSPLDRESCDPQRQSVCLFSERKTRFVCCKRDSRRVVTLEKCPSGAIQDDQRVFCSRDKPCPVSHFCVRRDSDRVGICCRHPSLGRQKPSSTTTPSTTPAPPVTTASTTTIVITTTLPSNNFKLSCPTASDSFVDIRTGEPQLCNGKFPCPPPYVCTPVSPGAAVRVCCARNGKVGGACDDGTIPLSIDGRIYSCRIQSCPPGYRCTGEKCCPTKEIACSEPPFMGTVCSSDERSTTRFFFDVETVSCRLFNYRGCNPSANTFIDETACQRMCLPQIDRKSTSGGQRPLHCPSPFKNPGDWPQICEMNRDSCATNEECVPLASSESVCCLRQPSASLRSLMLNMCGDDHSPVFTKRGDPLQCSRDFPCSRGQTCMFSTVLMVDICCTVGSPSEHSAAFLPPLIPSIAPPPSPIGDAPVVKRKLFPGDTGCSPSLPCRSQSICIKRLCACRKGLVQFKRMCHWKCPPYYKNIAGVCV